MRLRATSSAIGIGSMARVVTRRLRAMGIRDKPIAPASPWQNGFAERLIGSIRRECVDHIIVLGEAHLRRILRSYARLLQRHQNAPIIEQRCAGLSPGSANRNHQFTRHPWRTSSPLRPGLGFRYTQPSEIIRKWQEIVNLLAEIMHVPSASIMRVDPPHIKVFVSSTSEGNPCEPGALDTGPYCETVMKTGQPLLIPDALENEAWKANPHVRLGMISYLGVPIGWPNGRIFGTICVRDNKRNEYSEAYLKLLLHFRDMLQADLKSLARLHGEIEERETKIRRLVDSNILGVFIWDFDGRILEANDEFLRMVSYDREDLVSGRIRWADLTPPDWRDRNNARIEQQKSSGRFEPFEKEYARKDGSRVPVLIGGATFEEGGNQGVAYVLDLTERKRIEAEARENEQRYREAQLELAHANRVATMGAVDGLDRP